MIKNRAAEKLVRAEVIKSTLIVGQTSRHIVKLDDSYPFAADVIGHDPLIRVTYGTYFIKYQPDGSFQRATGFPFSIGNDLVGFALKAKNSQHFEKMAEIFPEVAWILRNTNYSPKLFAIAKMHPGMPFGFSVNWADYVERLTNWGDAHGIDLTINKPLITFRVSEKICNYDLDDKAFAPTCGQYATKIAEAKRIAAELTAEE